MTHSWPSPGPLSPSWEKGTGTDLEIHGKGEGKGKGKLDLISKGKGQKGRLVVENGEKEQEQDSEKVVQSSQQTKSKPPGPRGKNMAVLAKLQKNEEELDFESKVNAQKEHDSVSSSSDSKSSKPSAEAETVSSTLKQSPSSSPSQSAQKPNNMKTIDEKALHEIQSVHPPPPPAPMASKVLEEAGSNELEELAQTLCKTTTELELSAFVTRALDLSVVSPVGKLHIRVLFHRNTFQQYMSEHEFLHVISLFISLCLPLGKLFSLL